jgi:hypothetical protein
MTSRVLRQATKVLCMAEELCDNATKAGWQPCAYSIYRWRMEQEVGYLYACLSGPDEEEAVVKAQRKAKTWLTKAHKSVERARERIGSHLRKVPDFELLHFCRHDGPPPQKADPATCKLSPLFSGPVVHGIQIRNACETSAAKSSKQQASQPGTEHWR